MAPCIVVGCKTGYGATYSPEESGKGLQTFKFPEGKALKDKWLSQINRGGDFKPTKFSYVCEKHFEEKAFRYVDERGRPLKKKKLTKWAYPTLFLRPVKKTVPRSSKNSTKNSGEASAKSTAKQVCNSCTFLFGLSLFRTSLSLFLAEY